MDPSDSLYGLTIALQVVLVDLMLGADNALLIGLACRSLPESERKRAAAIGVGGAIVLRLLMTMLATSLLALPFVKLVGAAVLMVIALNLAGDPDLNEMDSVAVGPSRRWAAAAVIVVADAAMSIDNVVALAAIARGSLIWLLIGVGLSLPMLGYGGLLVARWLRHAPALLAFGAALLGWIAGEMAASDPLYADWIATNAPGLLALAPLLGAAFVFLHGRLAPRPVVVRAPRVAPPKIAHPPVARPAPKVVAPPAPAPPPEPRAPAPSRGKLRQFLAVDNSVESAAPGVDDRLVIVGVLLLAVVAGGFIALAAFWGG